MHTIGALSIYLSQISINYFSKLWNNVLFLKHEEEEGREGG